MIKISGTWPNLAFSDADTDEPILARAVNFVSRPGEPGLLTLEIVDPPKMALSNHGEPSGTAVMRFRPELPILARGDCVTVRVENETPVDYVVAAASVDDSGRASYDLEQAG